jgi:hypothetical protein
MLQQLFHIVILSAICIIWGIPSLLVLSASIKEDQFWYHSTLSFLSFLFFCGCLTISFISGWAYLFIPLKFIYLILPTVVLAICLFIFQRKKIQLLFSEARRLSVSLSAFPLLFLVFSIFLFILLSALRPVNGDTQIYHLQIIQWQIHYGVVPGVANLYPRFGLGSNWFNLISIFYWPIFKNENFTYLNAGFVIWFMVWLFSKWNFYSKKSDQDNVHFLSVFYFLLLVYCMFDWQLYRDADNSTNYDFAVTAFIIIISSFFIEGVFTNKSRNKFSIFVLLFSLCAISFKLSGIFLLLFILYHILTSWKTINWFVMIITGIFFLVPVFLKNYIITGYPLFPSMITINNPDWMLPKSLANKFYEYIILSNRFYNYQWSFINKFEHSHLNWIPYWFHGILWKHRIILLLALSSLWFLFKKPSLQIDHKQLRFVVVILLLMMIGWFFTAPDPGRFGYGILLSTCTLTVSSLTYYFFKPKIYYFIFLITTTVVVIYTIKKSKPVINHLSYMVYPAALPNPPYQLINLNEIDLKLPYKINNNWDCRCYFTPIPCIIQKNPYIQTRGKSLKDGFRMSKPDSSFADTYFY